MNIIKKYLDKKTKYILDYSKKFNDIFSYNELTLIKGKVELNQILNVITKTYIDKYWFNKEESFIVIGDYYNFNIKDDKEINLLIYEINEYYKNILKIDTTEYKKDIYYIALLISTGIRIDSIFNSISKNKKYEVKIKEILNNIKNNKIINFKIRKKRIQELIKLIKEKIKDENKFFEYFNLDEIYNKYKKLKTLQNYYFVKYDYTVDNNKYKPEYTELIFKREKIDDFYLMISYELLLITILKESNIKNSNIKYIVPITERLSNNKEDVDKIYKIFDKKEIRDKIYIMIDENVVLKNPYIVKRLKEKGFNLCTMLIIENKGINEVENICENKAIYMHSKEDFIRDIKLINNIIGKENK